MVTTEHESPIELNRRFPSMLLEQLAAAGIDLPGKTEVTFDSERCTEVRPQELNADTVATLSLDGDLVMAVVYEVQRGKDDEKLKSWPRYATATWARYGCPVTLLIYCEDVNVARWASHAIDMGPCGAITPIVITPRSFPLITDPGAWDGNPRAAVLGAVTNVGGAWDEQILGALCEILASLDDEEEATNYAGCLVEILSEPARTIWEQMMTAGTYSYQSAFKIIEKNTAKRAKAEGKAEGILIGERNALFTILSARGIDVSDADRDRIMACQDVAQFEIWNARAVNVSTVGELFD